MLGMCTNGLVPRMHQLKMWRWALGRERKGMLFQSGAEGESDKDRDRIVILGGGFGGLNAALTLDSLPWSRSPEKKKPLIKLIDDKERFVFLPLLYELCRGHADLEEVAPTFKELLKDTHIEFVQGDVTGLDAANNRVHYRLKTDKGSSVSAEYDALLVATGCNPLSTLKSVPGAEEHALTFQTIDDCYELKRRLALLQNVPDPQIAIVGGGYSGVELALSLADLANVTLIHRGDAILPNAPDFNRQAALDRLNRAGVRLLLQTQVSAITAAPSSAPLQTCSVAVQGNTQENIRADILLWTAGTRPLNDTGVLNSLLPRDTQGRIVTSPSLRVLRSPNVFAVGDAARINKTPFPATAQVAMQQASVAAWNIRDTLLGNNTLLKFRFLDLGQIMTLGEDDATISSLGGLFALDGPRASEFRRMIYAVRMPTWIQKVRAGVKAGKSSRIGRNLSHSRSGGRK